MVAYEPSTNCNSKRPGTTVRFHCNENYALVGNPTRVCQQNSTWNGSEPECRSEYLLASANHSSYCNTAISIVETCEELVVPENGSITYAPLNSSPRKPLQTVAIYSCDEGYSLNLSSFIRIRVCEESEGTPIWSGHVPSCIGEDFLTCRHFWYLMYGCFNTLQSGFSAVSSCQLDFAATGGCCAEGSCFTGPLSSQCSCSAECFTSASLICCPDIECPRKCC